MIFTEAEFRLYFYSANWNPYNEEHLNKVSVFQHTEKLILTLLMSFTKPNELCPDEDFIWMLQGFAFSARLKLFVFVALGDVILSGF